MASEQTPNLGLNKWAPYDYLRRAEFNQNWDKIDTELGKKSNQTDLTNLSQVVSANHTVVTEQLEELAGSVGSIGDVTGLATAAELATLEQNSAAHQANETTDAHVISNIIGLQNALDGKANKNPTLTWDIPILLNGWSHVDTLSKLSYTKDDFGFVHISGRLMNGVTTTNTKLFNLPTGFRVGVKKYLPFMHYGETGEGYTNLLGIDVNGDVYLAIAGKQYLTINLTFKSEQ